MALIFNIVNIYVWSIAMYGCETWIIGEAERKRLESFEMSCYRRMRNIKWMDRITNEEVLAWIEEKRTLWKSLKKRRGQMLGHTHTHWDTGDCLGVDILEGEVGKKRGRGRPRLKYFDQIKKFEIWDARHLERSNSWRGTEPSGDEWLHQTSLRTVYSMMMMMIQVQILSIWQNLPRFDWRVNQRQRVHN